MTKRRPRIEKIKARLLRKFWTRCPRCGGEFGGHEAYGKDLKFPEHPDPFRIVCPRCRAEYDGLSSGLAA